MSKKQEQTETANYSYLIYPPGGNYISFRLIKYYKITGKTESLKLPELDNVNKSLVEGKVSVKEARTHVEKLRKSLYQRDGVPQTEPYLSPENKKLLDKYWNAEYAPRLAALEDPDTAKYELRRALEALGKLPLESSTQKNLQKHLDSTLTGNKHRRVVVKLNSMLKFLNREFLLKAAEREKAPIKFITLSDLPLLLKFLPDEDTRTLHAVCFYTGVSIGESFALDQRTYSVERDTIRVQALVDKEGSKKETAKTRTTVVIPQGRDTMMRWFQIRSKYPQELRRRISRYTKKAAALAFPDSPSKHITFNDLRHSYAIHLLKQGVPLSLVAECLGIEPKTAKDTYGNFDISGDSLSLVSKTLRRKPA